MLVSPMSAKLHLCLSLASKSCERDCRLFACARVCVCVCVCPHSVEVVDYVSGVAASEVRHGHRDLLVVVAQVDAHVLLQLLAAAQRSVGRVLVENPAVEQVLLGDLHTNTRLAAEYSRHTFLLLVCEFFSSTRDGLML